MEEVPVLEDTLGQRSLRSSLWTLINVAVGLPLLIASTIFAARLLGQSEFGRFAFLTFALGLTSSLSDIGITGVLQRRISIAYGTGSLEEQYQAARGGLLLTALKSIAIGAVGLLLLNTSLALTIYLIALAFQIPTAGITFYLTGTSQTSVSAKLGLFADVLAAVATILSARISRNADITFAFDALALAAPQALLLALKRLPVRNLISPSRISLDRSDVRYAIGAFGNGQLANLVFSRSELAFFAPPDARGRGAYAAASTIGSRATLLLDALFGPAPVTLATMYGRGPVSYTRALRIFFNLSGTLFCISFPLLGLWGVTVGPELFGSGYEGLESPTAALLLLSLLQTGAQPMVSARLAQGRAGQLLAASAASTAINLLLSATLILPLGLTGAVISNVSGGLCYILWVAHEFRRDLPTILYMRYLLVAGTSSLAGVGLGVFADSFKMSHTLTACAFTIPIVSMSILACRASRTFGVEEVEVLRAKLNQRWWPLLNVGELLLARTGKQRNSTPANGYA